LIPTKQGPNNLFAYLWGKFTKYFYCICLIIGFVSLAVLIKENHYSRPKFWEEVWKALSISGVIIGSYLWIRRDLWVTREAKKQDPKLADQQAACLVAFVWLIIIVPLAVTKTEKVIPPLFFSTLFLLLPVSNGIARWLEKRDF